MGSIAGMKMRILKALCVTAMAGLLLGMGGCATGSHKDAAGKPKGRRPAGSDSRCEQMQCVCRKNERCAYEMFDDCDCK